MRYARIIPHDVANGEGVRVSLFVTGCDRHCPGCFNEELQDFEYGKEYTQGTEAEILELLKAPEVSGLSILGGEPLSQDEDGLSALLRLCHETHSLEKDVWLWTGWAWENIFRKKKRPSKEDKQRQRLVCFCDVVVDGAFEQALADPSLKWKGSSNQRVIDVLKTILHERIVEAET